MVASEALEFSEYVWLSALRLDAQIFLSDE